MELLPATDPKPVQDQPAPRREAASKGSNEGGVCYSFQQNPFFISPGEAEYAEEISRMKEEPPQLAVLPEARPAPPLQHTTLPEARPALTLQHATQPEAGPAPPLQLAVLPKAGPVLALQVRPDGKLLPATDPKLVQDQPAPGSQ